MSDVRRLGWARLAIGTLILLRTTPILAPVNLPFLRSAYPLLAWPDGGWSVASLPPTFVALLCIVRTAAAVCFTIGYRARVTGLLCGLSGLAILIDDPFQFVFTLVQLYLSAIVLSLTDAGAAISLFPAPVRSAESGRWLIRTFLASIYFWAGVYKLRADWLDGRTFESLQRSGALSGGLIEFALQSEMARRVAAWSVVGVELSLAPALLARQTRRWGVLAAFAFHGVLQVTASPDFFGFGMCALLFGCWESSCGLSGRDCMRSRRATSVGRDCCG